MQWLYADDYHCDDHCLLVIPSSRFNTAGRIGARNQSTMTLCTRSLSPSTLHSPCTPLAMFLGACRVIVAAINFTCESHAEITCARSRSQHRTFVTRVNNVRAAHRPKGWFASFSSQQHSAASQAAVGVCVHDSTHAGVVFRTACTKS